MTTPAQRPTAEEIAALFAKHGVRPGIGELFSTLFGPSAPDETCCALGVLLLDRHGNNARTLLLHHEYTQLLPYPRAWCYGLGDGFDNTAPCFIGDANYDAGYAVGQAVRALVLPEVR